MVCTSYDRYGFILFEDSTCLKKNTQTKIKSLFQGHYQISVNAIISQRKRMTNNNFNFKNILCLQFISSKVCPKCSTHYFITYTNA